MGRLTWITQVGPYNYKGYYKRRQELGRRQDIMLLTLKIEKRIIGGL